MPFLHTSFERVDRCRDLGAQSEEIGQRWECYGQEDTQGDGRGEYDAFRMLIVELSEGVHGWGMSSIILPLDVVEGGGFGMTAPDGVN